MGRYAGYFVSDLFFGRVSSGGAATSTQFICQDDCLRNLVPTADYESPLRLVAIASKPPPGAVRKAHARRHG